jgi:diguanylate cyclase (GGDEF)-like protein
LDISGKLERVAQLSREAASATDGAKLLRSAAASVRQIFSCRSVALVLVSEESDQLAIAASSGISEAVARDWRRSVGTGLVADVLRAGASVLYDHLDAGTPELAEFTIEHSPQSLLCVRLEADSRSLGYLLCESDKPSAFAEGDLHLLRVVAAVTALALSRDALRAASRKLIMIDPLTQVYSYAYFHRRFTEEVERAERLNEDLSLLLVEIDNLQDYRQTQGWQATEHVLCDLVKQISSGVRNIDIVGRYGVGSVILYLPETPRDKALLAAERIRALVEKGSKAAAPSGLTVSVGVASLPENGDTVNRLLESVTAAVLAAQRAGRNRVQPASTGAGV